MPFGYWRGIAGVFGTDIWGPPNDINSPEKAAERIIPPLFFTLCAFYSSVSANSGAAIAQKPAAVRAGMKNEIYVLIKMRIWHPNPLAQAHITAATALDALVGL